MATRIVNISDFPVNLLATNDIDGQPVNLEVGKTYAARYVALDVQAVCKVLEVPDGTTVTVDSPALPLRSFEDFFIAPATGESIFIWSEGNGRVIVNDTE